MKKIFETEKGYMMRDIFFFDKIYDGIQLNFTSRSVQFSQIDQSRVLLVRGEISRRFFDKYEISNDSELKIKILLNSLVKALEDSYFGEKLSVFFDDETNKLVFAAKDEYKKNYKIATVDNLESECVEGKKEINNECGFILNSEELQKILRNSAKISVGYLNFEVKDKIFTISADADDLNYAVEIDLTKGRTLNDDEAELLVIENCSGNYDANILRKLTGMLKLSSEVIIGLGNDKPVYFKVKLFDDDANGYIECILAPAVHDEDEIKVSEPSNSDDSE